MTLLPQSVLFICERNIIRSPIAAAFLKLQQGRTIYVDDAGITAGDPDTFVTTIMAEIGIDLTAHEPKSLDLLAKISFDLVIGLSLPAYDVAQARFDPETTEIEYWRCDDPSAIEGNRSVKLDAYRCLREALRTKITARFAA